jgi:hypothetical protein
MIIRSRGTLLAVGLALACGGENRKATAGATSEPAKKKAVPKVEACALLTPEEVEAAAGWKPAATEPKTYQTTSTCAYHGLKPLTQTVVLVVSTPAPKLASSTAMAEWRSKQAARHPDIKLIIKPVEGLGVPAISNELEGSGKPSLEVAADGLLLGVTASSLELAQALAAKAIPRLH